jgi:hypothetical protein
VAYFSNVPFVFNSKGSKVESITLVMYNADDRRGLGVQQMEET